MSRVQQQTFEFAKVPWKHRHCYGGTLRQKRRGRGARPLSSKQSLHLVLKANRERIRNGFRTYQRFFLIHDLLKKYARKFFIKVDQISVQGDHIHLHIRTTRRSNYQSFFRVFAGQIAQQFEKEGLLTLVTDTPEKPSKACGKGKVTDTPKGSKSAEFKVDLRREMGIPAAGVGAGARASASMGTSSKLMKKLWKYRPFTRVVNGGRKAYQSLRNYIQLNEKEALGEIPYRKQRLKGLSAGEWEILWS